MTQRSLDAPVNQLLEAILPHVAFDGWTEPAFLAAQRDAEMAPALARAVCPRGAIDLAVAYHKRGDQEMIAALHGEGLAGRKIRDKITLALRRRIEVIDDKEAVRRATTLFALPIYATDGAKLIWGTCDLIWSAIGDTSDDFNWYSKRATLSAVYSATVLYWLGDQSEDHSDTWAFIDRRIENVMEIEKVKAKVKGNPFAQRALALPFWMMSKVRAPMKTPDLNMPGQFGYQDDSQA